MNSSGIKRGLATTAVSALAVTGIPFIATSAHAIPLEQQATSVDLISQVEDVASVAFDGQNRTIRLEAAAPATVSNITFFYQVADNDPVKIATVSRNDDGAFSHEWNGPIGVATIDIVAVATNADGQFVTASGALIQRPDTNPVEFADGSEADDLTLEGVQSERNEDVTVGLGEAVNITDATQRGVFQSPYTAEGRDGQYVAVDGTTSSDDENDTVLVSATFPQAVGDPRTAEDTAPVDVAENAATGTWDAVLDIAGYRYATNGDADQLAVVARQGATAPRSDDVESFTLYRQTITTVTATVASRSASGAVVVVTVTDQNGNPVAGARVTPSADVATTTDAYTDGNGQVAYVQTDGTAYYYADATNLGGFQTNLGDRRSDDVSVNAYVPAPTALDANSNDGDAFDFDEYDEGDVTIQVEDQEGNKFSTSQELRYYWVLTPFAEGAQQVRFPTATTGEGSYDTATPISEGKYRVETPWETDVDPDTEGTQRPPAGTYELYAGLQPSAGTGTGGVASSKVLTVKAGEAEIDFDEAREEAVAGGDEEVTGRLELEDGTALGGRSIRFDYAAAAGSDTTPDAGIVQASGTTTASTRTVSTAADGSFTITIRDRAETPQGTESGTLSAATVDSNFNGVAGVDGNAVASATQAVVFAQETPPQGSTVTITGLNATGDGARPGVKQDGVVTVRDAAGQLVPNQLVTLTVDGDSFFTDGSQAAAPAIGQDRAGNIKNFGQTITVVTGSGDAAGSASFGVSVARSEEFDDDGLAEDIVTATAGTVTDTEDVDYTSANPLNGGEVRLEFAPASEQDAGNVLPDAQPGSEVEIDVYATDQFGNLVGGELVTVADNTTDADIVADDASTGDEGLPGVQVLSDFDDDGDFAATADEQEEQTITGTWVTEADRYIDNGNGQPVASTANETLRDSISINWEFVEVAEATITSSPEGDVPVGTAVTETVTVVDSEGNPVPGVDVTFTQAGPGSASKTTPTQTNSAGQAFFVVTSAEAGDALVTAVVETAGAPITLTDTVTFGDDEPVVAVLKGRNNGKKADKLRVVTNPSAAGSTVKFFKFKNGDRKLVATGAINENGKAFFKVADRNGKKFTRYIAKVQSVGMTNAKRVR